MPFQQRFAMVDDTRRATYFVTLLASACASALFIAPTAYHRLLFERGDKPRIVRMASRCAIAGLVMLGVAMTGAVVLVTDLLFGLATVLVTGIATGLLFAGAWFGLALLRRTRAG